MVLPRTDVSVRAFVHRCLAVVPIGVARFAKRRSPPLKLRVEGLTVGGRSGHSESAEGRPCRLLRRGPLPLIFFAWAALRHVGCGLAGAQYAPLHKSPAKPSELHFVRPCARKTPLPAPTCLPIQRCASIDTGPWADALERRTPCCFSSPVAWRRFLTSYRCGDSGRMRCGPHAGSTAFTQ